MKFENPEITTSKIETTERTRERLRELQPLLKPLLENESEKLRGRGFPVGADGRLLPEEYKGIYRPEEITNDLRKVRLLESKYREEEGKPIGDLLEVAKTLAFNRFWFGGRLIAVRASNYDDYFNGVDEIIFDAETFQSLAAIDTTVNPLSSFGEEGKRETDKILKKSALGSENEIWSRNFPRRR